MTWFSNLWLKSFFHLISLFNQIRVKEALFKCTLFLIVPDGALACLETWFWDAGMEILILPIWLSFVFWSPNSHLQRKKDNTFSVCARNPIRLYLYCSYIFIKSRILTECLQRVLHFLRWSRGAIFVIIPETPHWWCWPSLPWSCTGCSSLPLGLSTWPGVLRIPGKHLNLSSRCTISFFRNKSKQLQMFFTEVLFQPDLVDACSKDSQCWMVSWFCNPMYTIYKIIYIVCMHTIYGIIKNGHCPSQLSELFSLSPHPAQICFRPWSHSMPCSSLPWVCSASWLPWLAHLTTQLQRD